MSPLLGFVTPWTAMAALLGALNAAFFFLLLGRSLTRLPVYLACGALIAALVQPLGVALIRAPGGPAWFGEVSLVLVSASVWLTLGVAKALRL
jgi:hypothetical protein